MESQIEDTSQKLKITKEKLDKEKAWRILNVAAIL